MNYRTIQGHVGITEDMIVRAANRISFSLPGEELADLRAAHEGDTDIDVTMLYCAAKTYLSVRARDFKSERQTKPTVREMKAIRLPRV
jgi:hypothetical protein